MTADAQPPPGIEPEWISRVRRLRDLEKAISRYIIANRPVSRISELSDPIDVRVVSRIVVIAFHRCDRIDSNLDKTLIVERGIAVDDK